MTQGPLPVPSFVTRHWVERNIGNIQNSDMRAAWSYMRKSQRSNWPDIKPTREEFIDLVHVDLTFPSTIEMLNQSLGKVRKKRSFFRPLYERAIDHVKDLGVTLPAVDTMGEFREREKLIFETLRKYEEWEMLAERLYFWLHEGLFDTK